MNKEKKIRRAAGIDVGTEKLFVAVVNGPVKVFFTFTCGLRELREFLLQEGVTTVAMEATGVYWIAVYEMLREVGLEVCVVNAAHARNLPARKTDMKDCQWIAYLHSKGLLTSGFVPPDAIRELRDYWRLRKDEVEMASAHLQHMQKALDQMNIKIHEVLTDMTGFSALALVEAILAGERSPEALLAKCDVQIQEKKAQRMRQALEGMWKESQLFALRQAYEDWKHYQRQIAACDAQIAELLKKLVQPCPKLSPQQKIKRKRIHHNAPQIPDLEEHLVRLCNGQDLQKIPTMTAYTVAQILSETGTDMSVWSTEKHFTAWLGLAPGARDSGKKKRSAKRFRGRAGKLFCVAARSLARSRYLALGGFYRRVRGKRGGQVANIAAARKIAVLFYNTLRHGWDYVEAGLEAYEQRYRERMKGFLVKQAKVFGMKLVPEPLTA